MRGSRGRVRGERGKRGGGRVRRREGKGGAILVKCVWLYSIPLQTSGSNACFSCLIILQKKVLLIPTGILKSTQAELGLWK